MLHRALNCKEEYCIEMLKPEMGQSSSVAKWEGLLMSEVSILDSGLGTSPSLLSHGFSGPHFW